MALSSVGVDGDVDVGSDAVVRRESVFEHGGADVVEGAHPSLRRPPVVIRVARDGQILQDRVQLRPGLDVQKAGEVPALISTGQADVALVHAFAPCFVEVVRVQDRTDLPDLGVELTRCDVLRDVQQRLLDQPGLGNPDVLERIRERDDVLERDRPDSGPPHPRQAGHGTSTAPAPSDGSGRRPGAARVGPTCRCWRRRRLRGPWSRSISARRSHLAAWSARIAGLDRPDLIAGRRGDRPHRTRSIAQGGDGGFDVLRHALDSTRTHVR